MDEIIPRGKRARPYFLEAAAQYRVGLLDQRITIKARLGHGKNDEEFDDTNNAMKESAATLKDERGRAGGGDCSSGKRAQVCRTSRASLPMQRHGALASQKIPRPAAREH
eukprot:768574-Pyramimonas_sp.AAC.1